MTQHSTIISKQHAHSLSVLIDSIAPFFQISPDVKEVWILWLDFLLEIQAKLMVSNEPIWEDDFAFRCSTNFQAIRKTMTILAHSQIDQTQLEELKKLLSTNNSQN